MVKKSHAKRKRDIKTKLMAAICMLLVSSIMMVSTTYAWFTLSTAPEVTGINTSVGANGNLEMALLPERAATAGINQDYGITSATGDSTKALDLRNVTWGNLVDLSYTVSNENFYGLDKITLYPAALNGTPDAHGNPTNFAPDAGLLKTPTYGADGRVDDLVDNTLTSLFENGSFPQKDGYGVRAVGSASGMTERQLAYRNARAAASTAMSQAKTLAAQSLNTNGASLANIAMSHAANKGEEKYIAADIDKLEAIVNDLMGTAGKTGVLQYIEEAYRSYLIAYLASQAAVTAGIDDTEFGILKNAVEGAVDVYAALALFAEGGQYATDGSVLPASLSTPVAALQATKAKVASAQEGLAGITKTEGIEWGEFSTHLTQLADMEAMKINGYAASGFREHMSDIINSVLAQGGLVVSMATGGGVYADVADHCGNYTASITIEKVEYNGMALDNMTARMATETTVKPVYLEALGAAAANAGSPTGAGGETMPLSDFFGFVIDLAFRTNAADSDLLLQADGVDRIYDSNGLAAETMGKGSTMTFTSTTPDFTVAQMQNLMEAIRVVFYNPMDGNVYATAKLDVDNGTVTGGNTVEAKMYLYKMAMYDVATDAEKTGGSVTLYTESNGTYTEATYDASSNATYYVKRQTAREVVLTDNVITSLTQNRAQAVSALVYLDGEHITNADVAATAATSMTGTMNLQFASSANLVPMEYTQLQNTDGGYPVSFNLPSGVTTNGAASGSTAADYSFSLYSGETVIESGYTVTYQVNGVQGTKTLTAVGGVYTIPKADLVNRVQINVVAANG